jgi:hypothetical protein
MQRLEAFCRLCSIACRIAFLGQNNRLYRNLDLAAHRLPGALAHGMAATQARSGLKDRLKLHTALAFAGAFAVL